MSVVSTVLDFFGVSTRSTACIHRIEAVAIEPVADDAYTMTAREHWRESRCGFVVRRWTETLEWAGSPNTGWLRTDVTETVVTAAPWQRDILTAAFRAFRAH